MVAFLALREAWTRAIDGHGRTLEVAKRAQRDDVVAFLERQDPELRAKARQGRSPRPARSWLRRGLKKARPGRRRGVGLFFRAVA